MSKKRYIYGKTRKDMPQWLIKKVADCGQA
jgi:hypothetical protein